MPEQIESGYDFTAYPWTTLFDGKVWKCIQGTDFKVRPETFRTYARAAARERGLVLDDKVEADGSVVLRARKLTS